MRIKYIYKDKEFDDIRDIVNNNRLEIDYRYILEEYIPYQLFMSYRTFFKDIKIKPTILYDPNIQGTDEYSYQFLVESFKEYLEGHDLKNVMAAVSGGIDSSVVALEIKPSVIYSGYYNDDDCNELPFSRLIKSKINATHHTICLEEDDFINNLDEFMDVICSPMAGLGCIMEYVTLKKALEKTKATHVLFGNGGDEIFLGYYYNYYIKDFLEYGHQSPIYMSNFLPQKKYMTDKLIDLMIIASLNRSGPDKMYESYATFELLPVLKKIPDIIDKLLYMNINVILPSLLHANNQMCKALGVTSLNPLTNKKFIYAAKRMNNPFTIIPKLRLREVHPDMPIKISENYIKRGFPIPLKKWTKVNELMDEYHKAFYSRKEITDRINYIEPYKKNISRYGWGVMQSEIFLRHFGG